MRRAAFALLTAFAATSLAAPVPAPKPDEAVSPSAARLLEHRKMQKELKLTAEQRIALVDGVGDIEEAHEKKINDLVRMPNFPDDAFDKLDKERRKALDKVYADAAAKSLTPAQRKRLAQLDLRVRGVGAFTDPRVEKLLELTADQKKKAAEFAERQRNAADSYFDNPGNQDDAKRRADLFDARKDLLKKMEEALTADQKANWQALLGDAPAGFALDELWLRVEEEASLLPPDEGEKKGP